MNEERRRYRVLYYQNESGREPVAEWIDNRSVREQVKLFWVLERLAESGFSLGPPWLKRLDDDIWEVRLKYGGALPRILFYQRDKHTLVLLEAFSKKTKRTPKRRLDTARARMMGDWEGQG